MLDATYDRPDLITFARLDALGLDVTGQWLDPDRAVLVRAESSSRTGGAVGAAVQDRRATR